MASSQAVRISSMEAAVARIAYVASDVVICVQYPAAQGPDFVSHVKQIEAAGEASLVSASQHGKPEIHSVAHNNDPLLSVFEPLSQGRLVTVTTGSSILVASIPYLYRLAQTPVVIHVALQPLQNPDYASITAIRNSGLILLQSESLQEAQDLAMTAHALAAQSGKGVIHFYSSQTVHQEDASVQALGVEVVRSVLQPGTGRPAKVEHAGIYTQDGNVPAGVVSNGTSIAPNNDRLTNSSAGSSSPDGASHSDQTGSASSVTTADSETLHPATPPATVDDILERIWTRVHDATGRTYQPFHVQGPADAETAVFLFGAPTALFAMAVQTAQEADAFAKTAIVTARVYRPWLAVRLVDVLPSTVRRIAILEQVKRQTTKWGPVLLDLLAAQNAGLLGNVSTIVGYRLGQLATDTVRQALRGVVQNLTSDAPIQNLQIGQLNEPSIPTSDEQLSQPKPEYAYMKMLDQVFGQNLYLANAQDREHVGLPTSITSNPSYGFGSLLVRLERRQKLRRKCKLILSSGEFNTQAPKESIEKWLNTSDGANNTATTVDELVLALESDGSALAQDLLKSKDLFSKESAWLIGSDAWSYDLGNSGVHHVIASGKDINMLIIDSTPYSERAAADTMRRKKDIGLYAMNYGNAYVASVAVYSSYTQVLQALIEADNFKGPSIVMAYLPYSSTHDDPLTALQETKKAVDIGYWPLYRWDPTRDNHAEANFSLDSERVKKELKDFLDRENHMTQLTRKHPRLGASLAQDYGREVREMQKRKAKQAYAQLLDNQTGAPLTIVYASDNGSAESLAKRMATRGKARGLKTLVMAMEDYPVEDLPAEQNLIAISSTAGQGEFPQNGRAFWDSIKDNTGLDLASVRFSVFALGDSHYWPRKEDKHYYNKPGKDLDRVLATLGAQRLADIGLGDDQDPDGYQTGYQAWEPLIWKALGVDDVDGLPDEPPPITNEDIKLASNFLRGTIQEGLEDTTTGAISASDQQLTKFHGTYMQDDRDLRDERKAQGLEPAYSFMIRCRLPGGVATPKQWIQMDDVSNLFGNETMKLTTRQTFQFHGVIKGKLKSAMRGINQSLMTTIAACGDVNRNVMCSSLPTASEYHAQVYACSQKISEHLLPSTTAYHEIWLKDEDEKKVQVAGDAVQDYEPLYGPTYLPRKFKITIAIPPHNDTDVYAHDIGLIAIKGEDGNLAGFNLLAGGGMGVTHNNKKTYPRTGSAFGFVSRDQVHLACEKVMLVQRDHGDRKNRKHARLKYTIDDMGLAVFKGKVEELWGQQFEAPRKFRFKSNIDTFGWQKDEKGLNHFTFFIENGRVEDTAEYPMKTGLRELAKLNKGEFRLTGNQHLIISNIADADLVAVKDLMSKQKLDNVHFSGLRLSSSACVAFPTCGLAMAESERYLPTLITKLEECLEENGLRQDSIVMRMTGCPNGCARPWLAEVGFVGKAYGAYNMYLGGGYHGQRLSKLYRSSIMEEEILVLMKGLLGRYARERRDAAEETEGKERFGDWCIRAGIVKETREGKDFHDDVAEEESGEE